MSINKTAGTGAVSNHTMCVKSHYTFQKLQFGLTSRSYINVLLEEEDYEEDDSVCFQNAVFSENPSVLSLSFT